VRDPLVLDLADCTEYRQALLARPPRVVHGTVILLAALLGAALTWSALTQADLVVRGTGRVRPVTTPVKVYNAVRGDALSATAGGRVVAVHARQGDRVRRGDVLVRLDTGRLDNEITRQARLVRAGEDELARLDQLAAVQARQSEAALAKAEAELAQAREEVRRAKERRDSEVRLAELALRAAEQEMPLPRLVQKKYIPPVEVLRATTRVDEARERLAGARIPAEEGRGAVLLRELEGVKRDAAVKREELLLRREAKRAEVEAARIEAESLQIERRQAVLRAPIDGVVTAGDVKAGDVLEPGKPVMEIARQAGFVFEAAVPSGEIGLVRVGMPARVKLDAYDYQRYGTLGGMVGFVSPDSGVPDSQDRAVYTVRIAVSRDELGRGRCHGRAKLGMAGVAEVVTGRESVLSLLMRRIRQTISLG
jgi:multidrug resistance efflux pump